MATMPGLGPHPSFGWPEEECSLRSVAGDHRSRGALRLMKRYVSISRWRSDAGGRSGVGGGGLPRLGSARKTPRWTCCGEVLRPLRLRMLRGESRPRSSPRPLTPPSPPLLACSLSRGAPFPAVPPARCSPHKSMGGFFCMTALQYCSVHQ